MAQAWRPKAWYWVGTLCLSNLVPTKTLAQIVPDSTLGTEGSQPVPATVRGLPAALIQGGALRGNHLFHSFSQFNVAEGQRVYFANPAMVQTILSRVTGADPSRILGTLGVDGGANLFLINPNGILFGANARLDIAGSFTASTASSLQFANGSEFSATNPQAPPLLTVNLTPGLQLGNSRPEATIVNRGQLEVGGDLTLVGDRLDLQGSLQAGGNLTLQAQDTVTIRDTATTPFLARSGGDLIIQGSNGIDILALANGSTFASRGNLNLISDGVISGDARFSSGGKFQITSLSGQPANFVSLYDPIISSTGDVAIGGNYRGASLLVESQGNVYLQNVNILAPDVTFSPNDPDPDLALLGSTRALIVRSGKAALAYAQTPLPVSLPENATAITPTIDDIVLLPGIQIDGTVTAEHVILDAASGNVQVGAGMVSPLITSPAVGRPPLTVTINAPQGNIRVSGIDATSSGFNGGPGGDVALTANQNIEILGEIQSRGTDGGNITLTSQNGSIRMSGIDFGNGINVTPFSVNGGRGGDVTLIAKQDIEMPLNSIWSSGNRGGGNITLTSQNGSIRINSIDAASFSNSSTGGDVTLTANQEIEVLGKIQSGGGRDGGNITLTSQNGSINLKQRGDVISSFGTNSGGNISLFAPNGSVNTSSGTIFSGTPAPGNDAQPISGQSGTIQIIAGDNISLPGFVGTFSADGWGGDLELIAGGDITTASLNTTGKLGSGNITLTSGGTVSLLPVFFYAGSGTSFSSVVSSDTFGSGRGGDIQVTAKTIALSSGTQISASTHASGNGGNIALTAAETIDLQGIFVNDPNVRPIVQPGFIANFGVARSPTSNYSGGYIPTGNTQDPAGSFVLPTGVFTQATVDASGRAGNIQIETPQLSISKGAAIAATTFGQNIAGNIQIRAEQVALSEGASILSGVAPGSGGSSGKIAIAANDLTLASDSYIQTRTLGRGTAGAVEITTNRSVQLTGTNTAIRAGSGDGSLPATDIGAAEGIRINTNSLLLSNGASLNTETFGPNNAGTIQVRADQVALSQGAGILSGVATGATGSGGKIAIDSSDLILASDSSIQTRTLGQGNAGAVEITANRSVQLTGANTAIRAGSGDGLGQTNDTGVSGDIQVNTRSLFLSNGASLNTETFGPNNAGTIQVRADQVALSQGAGILSGVAPGATGRGGKIAIASNDLILDSGSILQTQTLGAGNAGAVEITANRSVQLTGANTAIRVDSGDRASGNNIGAAGDIRLSTNALSLTNGASLNAETFSVQRGGSIFVNASTTRLQNDASIRVNSQGSGIGGDIQMTGGRLELLDRSVLAATTANSQGGNIQIILSEAMQMRRRSLISATAGQNLGEGVGGNITIRSPILLSYPGENNDIIANAFSARGGRIDIRAPLGAYWFTFRDRAALEQALNTSDPTQLSPRRLGTNDITAFSQNNPLLPGSVNLDAGRNEPVNLPTDFVDSDRLAIRSCGSSRSGARSSFVQTGKGGFPASPNQPLASETVITPLAELETEQASTGPTSSADRSSEQAGMIKLAGFWCH